MRYLYLIRHGNTFDQGQQVLRVGARTDLDLSASGRAQAAALGAYFAAIPLDAVISSPLKRAQQTAQALIDKQSGQKLLTVQCDQRLCELDYGPDEGQSEEQVRARLGDAALLAWETQALVPQGWLVDPERISQDWRMLLEELRGRNLSQVALVTSNGIARFIFAHINNRPDDLKLKTGAFARINLDTLTLELWNTRP